MRLLMTAVLGFSSWLGGGMHPGFCQDVMFLLDTSQSMNDSDAIRAAPDAIRAMVASLEPSDKAGILAYDTETRTLLPLSQVQEGQLPDFSGVSYQGYTNTGDAMAQALAALGKSGEKQRSVVLVTDGEIMMPDAEGTLHSSQQFAECMERASKDGIPVYVLSIQNGPDERDYKLYGGYAKGEIVPIGQLVMKARDLMRKDLHTCSMELDVGKNPDGSGRISSLSAKIPVPDAERLRVTAIASQPGRIALGGQLSQKADRVQVLQIPAGAGTSLTLQADYPAGTELKLDVTPSVDGVLKVETDSSQSGNRMTVRVTPMSSESDGIPLLADESFDGKTVHLTLNGQETEGTVQKGVISAILPESGANGILVEDIRFEELGIHFLGTNMVRILPSERGILPWILAGIGIALLGFLFWRQKRKKGEEREPLPKPVPVIEMPPAPKPEAEPEPEPEPEPVPEPVPKKPEVNHYRGKLALYLTVTPDDSDIPPLEYNLFRRARGQEVALSELIKGCGVELLFPGAEDIIIGPLRYGIYLQNNSDCTITKRGEILLKGRQVNLYYDERVHVAFSDEKSEMIMIYKSLKPNERG